VAEQLPRAGRFAIDKVVVARAAAEVAVVVHPVEGGPRRHRNARLRIVDDGRENGVEAELSVILRQAAERIDRAGDRDGLRRAEQRHMGVTRRAYLRRRQGGRRAARSVERDDILAARRFHQREAIAAHPGHRGLAQPQKNASGDRGIHRVAARLQDIDRDFSRQWVRRRAHPVFRKDRRPARLMEIPHSVPPLLPVGNLRDLTATARVEVSFVWGG
jgi:hypothetical protein